METVKKIEVPKISTGSGFGIKNIIGLIFVLIGILLIIILLDFKLPINLGSLSKVLQYGAAAGSILGGLSMLFKKSTQDLKTI